MSERGTTLVEVLISVLLIAIVAGATFSVGLVARQNAGKRFRKLAAARASQKVLEALKSYVVADTAIIPGPGAAPNGWGLPGDSCGCYALAGGRHELDPSLWLPELAAAPYGGTIAYEVALRPSATGPIPDVRLDIDWSEP